MRSPGQHLRVDGPGVSRVGYRSSDEGWRRRRPPASTAAGQRDENPDVGRGWGSIRGSHPGPERRHDYPGGLQKKALHQHHRPGVRTDVAGGTAGDVGGGGGEEKKDGKKKKGCAGGPPFFSPPPPPPPTSPAVPPATSV